MVDLIEGAIIEPLLTFVAVCLIFAFSHHHFVVEAASIVKCETLKDFLRLLKITNCPENEERGH